MRKSCTKVLSLLLTAAMLLSMLSVAFAAEGGGADKTLTYGSAAQLINELMKDSGVKGYDASIIGAADGESKAVEALKSVGILDEKVTADTAIDGKAFDALLAAALNVEELTGIGEYKANSGTITVKKAAETIQSVVLWARDGANVTGDTNKFLCIERGSTWTPASKSGSLHVAGIIGYGTIAGIRAYGEKCYDLETKTYKGLTIYYNPYAGSANIVMPTDPRSYEMCYVEGGARLYPDYSKELAALVTAGAYNTTGLNGETVIVEKDAGKTAVVYTTDGNISVSDSKITSDTTFDMDLMNISTLAKGDSVIAATENAVINIKDTSIDALSGRGATAIAGGTLNIDGATITNRNGKGSHGTCVLYGSVIDIKNSTVDANTSALASDFGGGLILADNVKAYAQERGGGVLADGMTFAYITNSELRTAHDAAASTAGCGHLEIDNCVLEGNDKGILYSYVFGMLASNKSIFKVSNSQMSGNANGVSIQGNTIDVYLDNDTVSFGQGAEGKTYLIYAENPTIPAPFYTRANVYIDNMTVEGDICFDAATNGPCVVGYSETYLNVYIGENAKWTGSVVSTEHNGGVHLFRWNDEKQDYEEISYTLDKKLTVSKDEGVVKTFDDVPADAWYAKSVQYVSEKKLFNGISETTFAPNATMDRAMLATVLYRLAGEPAVTGAVPFTDVKTGSWETAGITWAAANKVVDGKGNGLYGPRDAVTRQEMVTMLYRYAKQAGYDVSASKSLDSYADGASTAPWAKEAMEWAVAIGLVQGDGTNLTPTASAKRAQVAKIIMSFCENYQ